MSTIFEYTNPIDLRNPLSDRVHGLILLRDIRLWNPSLMRPVLALPEHNKYMPSPFCWSYLGYDPLQGNWVNTRYYL